jgi:hypothetical protein
MAWQSDASMGRALLFIVQHLEDFFVCFLNDFNQTPCVEAIRRRFG